MGQRRPLHAPPDPPDRPPRRGADDGSSSCARCMLARKPKGCTTRASSTTPAASRSWPPSPASPATPSWRRRSRPCATSTTAAPRAPRSTPATARGSCSRCPTRSSARSPASTLPAYGAYAVGTAFLEGDAGQVAKTRQRVEELADEEGLAVLGWRDVPVDPSTLGATARGVMPVFSQLFVQAKGVRITGMALERMAFCLRKRAEHETDVYFSSLSSRTLVYKGMLTTEQLDTFYPDLTDERVASALAVVHSRFSTNTFPSWPLAHPFRFIAHNGEINTVMGNRNWMRAREALLRSDLIPGDLDRLLPDLYAGRVRLGELRRGAGAAPHGRPQPAARGADDDPGGLGEPPGDGPPSPRVLRVPLVADGAVGRSGGRGLHRRLPDRRRPRPQRSAPQPLLGHRRRPRRPGLRGRGARPRPGHDRAQGPAPAGPDVPRRRRRAPDHRGRRDQGRARRRASLRRVAARRPDQPRRHPRARARDPHPRVGHPASAGLRLHRRGAPRPARADGQRRRRADRLDGHRHADRRAQRQAAAAVRLLRPDVRPGDQPAPRRDPRGAGHLAGRHDRPRGQPPRPHAGELSPDRAAVPGLRQRRPGQDPSHQPRRQHAGLHHPRQPRPLRGRGRRRGHGPPDRRGLRRGLGRDRRGRPRHRAVRPRTAPPSWPRSRRCCSPAPSTTTWSARRRGPRSACWSRPATSARSTTSPS